LERIIQLADPEEARTLFGPKDVYLKILRDACGVTVTARNGLLKVDGEEGAVRRACEALDQLMSIIRRTGKLYKSEVIDIVYSHSFAATGGPAAAKQAPQAFTPRTEGQAQYVEAIKNNDIVFSIGPAGTGKTFLAVAMAVTALRRGSIRKIVLVRPVVEAGESLGFLPGDIMAKVNPYMRPLYDALSELIDFSQISQYIERDLVEIAPLAYMRGRTLNDAFIILDEAQNTSAEQMKMFLTRMGLRSKMVITGDITQVDLPNPSRSGLILIQNILKEIEGIAFAYLTRKDIVRHRLVERIVHAYHVFEEGRAGGEKGADKQ
jgi:phosphate starvation-inducible PhoH-like protein